MNREEYDKLCEDKQEIKFSDAFIRDWADRIAFHMNAAEDASYALHFGKYLERDGYQHNIEPCSKRDFNEYHIYRGIELLAAACEANLQQEIDENAESYPIQKYFYHRGVKFFELYKDKDDNRQPEEEETE